MKEVIIIVFVCVLAILLLNRKRESFAAVSFSNDVNVAGGMTTTTNANIGGGLTTKSDAAIGGNISGNNGTFTGIISGAKGAFSGDVSGVNGAFTGNVSGVKGTFSGDVSGNNVTAIGKIFGNTLNGQGNDRLLLTTGPNRYRTNTEGDWHMFDTVSGKNLAYVSGTGDLVATGNVVATGNLQGNSLRSQTDDRTSKPSNIPAGTTRVGFGSFSNNSSAPFSDTIALNNWGDGSGGRQNMIAFNKGDIGMKIYQGPFGGSSYDQVADVPLIRNGLMNVPSDSLLSNIKFTKNWSGYPDPRTDGAEISNDTSVYKTLMIVGNKSAGGSRQVGIWDDLTVSGNINCNNFNTKNLTFNSLSLPGGLSTSSINVGGITIDGNKLFDLLNYQTGTVDCEQAWQRQCTGHVTFSQPFRSGVPKVSFALRGLDFGDTFVREYGGISNVSQSGFDYSFGPWANSNQYSASFTWTAHI